MFVLDTNVLADLMFGRESTLEKLEQHAAKPVYLVAPVHYEVLRGLRHRKAFSKIKAYEKLSTQFSSESVKLSDWNAAADLWAMMRQQGRQFSDVDLLVAVMTKRLDAVLVTSDQDFDVLGIPQVNWRE